MKVQQRRLLADQHGQAREHLHTPRSASMQPLRDDTPAMSRFLVPKLSLPQRIIFATLIGVAVLAILYALMGPRGTTGSQYVYQVGSPGVGMVAPDFTLSATNGQPFSLAAQRGKTVLLFFQGGIGCEPCWTQLHDIERDMTLFRSRGIDEVVTITTDAPDVLRQKVETEQYRSPVLSDQQVTVSRLYHTNAYSMHGSMRDGHSFIVVNPDGTIRWRADYGGLPNFLMYVPDTIMLHQMSTGTGAVHP